MRDCKVQEMERFLAPVIPLELQPTRPTLSTTECANQRAAARRSCELTRQARTEGGQADRLTDTPGETREKVFTVNLAKMFIGPEFACWASSKTDLTE